MNFRRDFGASGRLFLPEDWFRQCETAPEALTRVEPSVDARPGAFARGRCAACGLVRGFLVKR